MDDNDTNDPCSYLTGDSMEYPKFSVLMSLYIKEKAEYFDECMKSLLNQTVLPSEIVIIFDGPISPDMYFKVDDYCKANPGLIKLIRNKENKGLGLALADGIPECTYELIARMDTDDIAREDRFEKQLQEFMKDPELDICGSNISEFDECPDNIIAKRSVPVSDSEIKRYQRRRDAFNHMTVMYKKTAVLSAGNYQDCPLMEDSLLWARMIMNGVKCKNIPDTLVYARIGKDMFERRGGFNYFLKYCRGRKAIKDTGFISTGDFLLTIMVQLIICLLPNRIRGFVFKKLLHR